MKRYVGLFLIVVICLSLVACGNSKYEKYETLIDCLEAEDYGQAYTELQKLAQSKQTEKVKTIEITMDNWDKYFEIVEEKQVDENQYGEIEDVYMKYYFKLKDDYKMANDNTEITMEYSYTSEWRYVKIDKDAGSIVYGDAVPEHEKELKTNKLIVQTTKTSLEDVRSWGEGMQCVATDFKVLRIEGTLYVEK